MTETLTPVPTRSITSRIPDGASWLHLIELERGRVQTKGRHCTTRKVGQPETIFSLVGTDEGRLPFSSHDFFHAVAKADLARGFTAADALDRADELAFANRKLLAWGETPLRLAKDKARFYKSHSTLAGQIGEGMTLLFMHSQHYPYWDHAQTVLRRALADGVGLEQPERLPHAPHIEPSASTEPDKNGDETEEQSKRHPDFICENSANEFAIAEAKGSFVLPGNPPSVKSDLASALDQIEAIQQRYRIKANKSYGVGTYLREVDDPFAAPSLVAFVDPPGPGNETGDFPSDWIRRGNYGAWLLGMGFGESGLSLRERRSKKLELVCLPVIRAWGREFAFTVRGVSGSVGAVIPPLAKGLPCQAFSGISMRHVQHVFTSEPTWIIYGLEVGVLHQLGRAIDSGDDRSLLRLQGIQVDVGRTQGTYFADGLTASVFLDGSLFGSLSIREHGDVPLKFMEFKL